jgi:hypothetical protein
MTLLTRVAINTPLCLLTGVETDIQALRDHRFAFHGILLDSRELVLVHRDKPLVADID